ncbi:MAG: hypothetical protein F6K37_01455 [Moorea sp. SIO4E2]|nr:hypothetical protein [Moorena sp. SIO4E2]
MRYANSSVAISHKPKFFDTEFCPPSPPTLGGTRVNLLLKVPQNWGTNGGLDVANETSQTTS